MACKCRIHHNLCETNRDEHLYTQLVDRVRQQKRMRRTGWLASVASTAARSRRTKMNTEASLTHPTAAWQGPSPPQYISVVLLTVRKVRRVHSGLCHKSTTKVAHRS